MIWMALAGEVVVAATGLSIGSATPLLDACGDVEVPPCRVPAALDAETIRRHLAAADEIAWADGGVFHVAARRDAGPVSLCCDIQSPMEPVEGEPDLWRLSVRMKDLDQAVLSVIVWPRPRTTSDRYDDLPTWRGPSAPPPMPTAPVPQGQITEHEFDSPTMGHRRRIHIYRPPGDGPMPVIYMADGAVGYAETLHPLIQSGHLPPVMIVGVESGPAGIDDTSQSSNIRSDEYLLKGDLRAQAIFDRHEKFFLEEVLPLAESVGASTSPSDRIVGGQSNGAAWALAMAGRHPDRFGKVLALSFGWVVEPMRDLVNSTRFGDVYLTAGTLEPEFHAASEGAAHVLRGRSDRVRFDSRIAGHSPTLWIDQFPLGVLWLLNPDGRSFDPPGD